MSAIHLEFWVVVVLSKFQNHQKIRLQQELWEFLMVWVMATVLEKVLGRVWVWELVWVWVWVCLSQLRWVMRDL